MFANANNNTTYTNNIENSNKNNNQLYQNNYRAIPLSDIIKSHRTKERAQTTEGGNRKTIAGIDVENLHQKSENEEQKKNNLNGISPVNHNSTRATRDSNFDKSTSLNENSEAKVGNLDDYNIGKQVGQGAYAVVKQAVHKPTGRLVAVKV